MHGVLSEAVTNKFLVQNEMRNFMRYGEPLSDKWITGIDNDRVP